MPAAIEQYMPQCEPARARGAWAVWGACVLAASAFLGLIVCAPVARAHGHAALALFCYQVFKGLCHQIPARSFYVAGEPLAVCARCFGIYVGFALGVLCYPLVRSLSRTDTPARVWLLLAALPTGIDFMLGLTGLWANTHTSRALTGALLGAVAAIYVVPGLVAFSLSVGAKLNRRKAQASTSGGTDKVAAHTVVGLER